MMKRYFLLIAYDGFNYAGWQYQADAISIQGVLQEVISTVLQTKITVVGSGRTDAKAHALGQVAHFDTEKTFNEKSFLIPLNNLLPDDIKVLDIRLTTSDFHARFSVLKKVYHYYFCTKDIVFPHLRKTHLHVKEFCDLALIQEACNQFIGTHDFTSFANTGSNVRCMTKTIYKIDCIKTAVGFCLEFTGSGFLYKMVRNIVGLLLAVNQGKITLEQINSILDAKDRRHAPASAPAHGLFLMKVAYPKQFAYLFPSENTKLKLQTLELAGLG